MELSGGDMEIEERTEDESVSDTAMTKTQLGKRRTPKILNERSKLTSFQRFILRSEGSWPEACSYRRR